MCGLGFRAPRRVCRSSRGDFRPSCLVGVLVIRYPAALATSGQRFLGRLALIRISRTRVVNIPPIVLPLHSAQVYMESSFLRRETRKASGIVKLLETQAAQHLILALERGRSQPPPERIPCSCLHSHIPEKCPVPPTSSSPCRPNSVADPAQHSPRSRDSSYRRSCG